MSTGSIPTWNISGVLPPYDVSNPTSANRSPYKVSLTDVALRFSTSPARIDIIRGLLDFREALHSIGLNQGFQWLDGSFLEEVEIIETRDPKDIDIVTFYHLPSQISTQQDLNNLNPSLFDRDFLKSTYKVDGSFVQLKSTQPEWLIERAAYWYSVWSHRRNELWKGFLQIDLKEVEDITARTNINASSLQTRMQP